MHSTASVLTALGILAAASPAWAHHNHYYGYGHHAAAYVGIPYVSAQYGSTCSNYISQGDRCDSQGDCAGAIAAYTQAIANDPNCAQAYIQRGSVYYDQGDYDRAIADDTQAIAIDHSCATAYNNRSTAWDAKNEFDKGIADTNVALAVNPTYVEAYVSRAALWFNKGEYDKALADDNQALAINPSFAQAYADRALTWNMKAEYEKAKTDYYQALAIDANNPNYLTDLAFFQATCLDARFQDAKAAFANASRAFSLNNGKNVDGNFSVLASVYAANGDFPQAIAWQTKALGLTTSHDLQQRYQARLELFKQSKPFLMDPKTANQALTIVAKVAG